MNPVNVATCLLRHLQKAADREPLFLVIPVMKVATVLLLTFLSYQKGVLIGQLPIDDQNALRPCTSPIPNKSR